MTHKLSLLTVSSAPPPRPSLREAAPESQSLANGQGTVENLVLISKAVLVEAKSTKPSLRA